MSSSTTKQAPGPSPSEATTPDSGPTNDTTPLDRSITLPWLVFYGVGVTVGAGIFALIGEIVGISGTNAPLAFLVAGVIAGTTGLCYAQLIARFPRAGGEAVFANRGLGAMAGRVAGLGVVATGTISSAAISIAFAGYVRDLVDVPERVVAAGLVFLLAAVATRGITESVRFAAAITVLEVGTLLVVIAFGLPALGDIGGVVDAFTPGAGTPGTAGDSTFGVTAMLAGAVVAFFAFVGFEDIANMAEETVDARRTAPKAILITLVVTLAVYVLLATIAVVGVDRSAIVDSSAPVADMFEALSGFDGRVISAIAVVAMVNGVLVQIVMASRVLYGMAGEGLVPAPLGAVNPRSRTPVRATLMVAAAILVLATLFPLVGLAKATSLVTLTVFALVDLSLFVIAVREPQLGIGRWRWVGLAGAAGAIGLAVWEVAL